MLPQAVALTGWRRAAEGRTPPLPILDGRQAHCFLGLRLPVSYGSHAAEKMW